MVLVGVRGIPKSSDAEAKGGSFRLDCPVVHKGGCVGGERV